MLGASVDCGAQLAVLVAEASVLFALLDRFERVGAILSGSVQKHFHGQILVRFVVERLLRKVG